MVRVEMSQTISCTPDEFLEFVMDIERYATVDRKIDPILWARRDGEVTTFACRPKLAGLRQPKVVQEVRLTPGKRVDIALTPRPQNRLAHAMAEFKASFDCTAAAGETRVVRTLEFTFTPLTRWLFEPLLRKRLPNEVQAELELAKSHFARRRES